MNATEENGTDSETIDIKKKTKFYCKQCDKYYASYKSFGNHTRSYHTSNKEKAQCPHCGNCFTRKDNLQQHIRLFHSSEVTKYSCKFCGSTFQYRNALTKHKPNCLSKKSNRESELKERRGEEKKFEVKTIILYTPASVNRNSVQVEMPKKSHQESTVMESNNEVLDSEPRKKHRRKPSKTFFLDDINNNNILDNSDLIEAESNIATKDDKALDCNICNITFLSEKDYISHKPYCEGYGF